MADGTSYDEAVKIGQKLAEATEETTPVAPVEEAKKGVKTAKK